MSDGRLFVSLRQDTQKLLSLIVVALGKCQCLITECEVHGGKHWRQVTMNTYYHSVRKY